jgi:V/A-type H+-transporting ATPase subunit C
MDDYAYITARVRAMRGRLIPRARYEFLLAQETPADLLEALTDSAYVHALAETGEAPMGPIRPDAAFRMEEALRRDLTRCLAKLRAMTSDRPRTLMEALLLRWDAYNLKTVLRGKRAAATMEEIQESTFPVGSLDEVALAELVRAPTIRAVADILQTWRAPLARPLAEGLKDLGEAGTLQPLEFELDRYAFAQAFRAAADGDENDRSVVECLRLLVDKANLLTALRYLEERSALSPIEAGRHFLEAGGRFTRHHFHAVVAARDLRRGLALLADTPYGGLGEAVGEGEPVYLPRLERKLDHAVLQRTMRLARRDPLGIGVVVAYVEHKLNEVRNLRTILRGITAGMGADQVAEWLIV